MNFRIIIPKITLNFGIRDFFAIFAPDLKQEYDMIRRQLQDVIEARMFAGKAIIVIGARQVGKSTLFNMVLEGRKEPALQLNCDEPEVQEMLSAMNTQELKLLIG